MVVLDMWSRPLTFQIRAVVSGVFKGFIPEQSSTATSSSFLERISERSVEQIVDSVVLVEAFKIFAQD